MKILKIFIFSAALIVAAEGCAQKKATLPEGVTKAQVDSLSYAFGVLQGGYFKNQMQLDYIDLDVFKKAMQDVLTDSPLRFDESTAMNFLQQYMMKMQEYMMAEQQKKNAQTLEEGIKFLEENKTKDGVMVTESGLQYKIINPGSDVKPTPDDTVVAKYRGTTIDGTEFDAWDKHGTDPAEFPLNGVIKGWTEGLQLIGEGGHIMLYVPSELAYGEPGRGGSIKPNSVLIFDVELVKVKPAAK